MNCDDEENADDKLFNLISAMPSAMQFNLKFTPEKYGEILCPAKTNGQNHFIFTLPNRP